ncbi:MAG: DUF6029 family protein [Schleiferiaceae bacterium]|nr:DUF6029 family protein [Schleiferiaceae bacterium]
MLRSFFLCTLLCLPLARMMAQSGSPKLGQLSGNFQLNSQIYLRDSLIDPLGEAYPDERLRAAGFLNLTYTRGNFRAGIRYENYQNNIIGLPEGFQGQGIPYRYARYTKDGLDVTAGNFYEQFGSGLVFRAYEERGLGLDNALDGVRLIYDGAPGITFKGLIGKQRLYFGMGDGIVRGADMELNLNELTKNYGGTNVIIGGSFVSRFQNAQSPIYNLPENVANGGLRFNLITPHLNWFVEGAYKSQDPNSSNSYIFKPGKALYSNLSYTRGSLGVILGYKYYDNFLYRSQREGQFTELLINYLPPLAELHTYTLPALYSYNVQANGETGFQAEVSYRFEKGSVLGGKYGTLVNLNFSHSKALDKDFTYRYTDSLGTDSTISGTDGYTTGWPGFGDITYARDFNVEVKTKLSAKVKGSFSYYNFAYNRSALLDGVVDDRITPSTDIKIVHVNAFVADVLWRMSMQNSIRFEGQLMLTEQDRGSWAMLLAEYSMAPHWFVALQNSYNFGNPDPALRVHYPILSLGYTQGSTKFQFTYGRQQQGVFCVGGICRVVPASNGFSLLITSNF